MTLGDKLSKLRKENNYTQEQLADILGVSRQAVSKWESDTTYPETEKLLKLGELYQCSMDYLLKDIESTHEYTTPQNQKTITLALNLCSFNFERKSKKSIGGLPLWHINLGYGRTAKGVIAIGFFSKGFVSFGLLSLGVFSFGVLSFGAIALGAIAIGLLSAAAVACGIIAFGAISIGIVSVGALSVGYFSVGASANGKYFAMGDHAKALIALGDTKATGSVYQKIGGLTKNELSTVKELLDTNVPSFLSWTKAIIKLFL
ncbi:MAG: helix-turn-helix transcriptional regulator [Lachnospiraceae bacterium]|nr:helix-turn-helix transcriptional regulator [Lachnospiraceae bacterium]